MAQLSIGGCVSYTHNIQCERSRAAGVMSIQTDALQCRGAGWLSAVEWGRRGVQGSDRVDSTFSPAVDRGFRYGELGLALAPIQSHRAYARN